GSNHEGAQIDLLIDRNDKVINLCEMKYSDTPYALTAKIFNELQRKENIFNTVTHNTKTIHLTMITTFGITHNTYANKIQSQVTLNDLFATS
ncbi:MAG: ATP-binding protein, partial [Bacteroidales bacterium]|nr:ATP-binding protein [Bacteroidales bacterium]